MTETNTIPRNIAIVNGIALNSYAFQKLKNDLNSLELVYRFAKGLPGVEKIVLFTSLPLPNNPGYVIEESAHWDLNTFLAQLERMTKGYTHIFYFNADCPFLDLSIAATMYTGHIRYFADYSFADGYPVGLTPEILNPDIIKRLVNLSAGTELKRDCIFDLIKKDINSFDIETEIAPQDLRMLRVNLFADNKRNFSLLQQLSAAAGSEQIMQALVEKPEIMRTLPAYYSIQIARDCPQSCSYCPYPTIRVKEHPEFMSLERFKSLLSKIHAFSEDAVINISLWGEPAGHNRIADIIDAVAEYKLFKLVIETSGIGWDEELLTALAQKHAALPVWIVSLDAADKALYAKLRGDGFERACKTAETLLRLFPGQTYIQAVRMVDNEDDLEQFYDNWKKKTENIIIQKYDSYSTFLPDKKVTDLSPVKRFPCWHVKRDLNILIDGTVPVCREDLACSLRLGNIFTDELEQIWAAGTHLYLEHLGGKYSGICAKCDEYYTYNF